MGFPRKWCLNIYNKMRDMTMTKLLSQEIANRKSNFHLDFEIIYNKLNDNSYKSTKEWVNDVNSVLMNELRYFDKNNQFYMIVQYLQSWFEKKVRYVPVTEMDAWMIDYQKVQKRMKKLSRLKQPA